MNRMEFKAKRFGELTNDELYRILQLRSEVFVVEQNCVYLDMDNNDQDAIHVMGFLENKIHAYTRIVPKGLIYSDYVSIGRVITSEEARNKSYGYPLMKHSIGAAKKTFKEKIKISAQLYIKGFYENLGFVSTGEEYLEDGIPHIAMIFRGN